MADLAGMVPGDAALTPSSLDRRGARAIAELTDEPAVARVPTRPPHPVAASRHAGDVLLRSVAAACSAAVLVAIAALIVMLIWKAWPSITGAGWGFFTQPVNNVITFQALSDIEGTLYTAILAIVLAAPVAILIAVYLAEMAPQAIKLPLGFMVELLAAVPSIVYGLWGTLVIVPLMIQYVNPFLTEHFGGFVLFADASSSGQEYLTIGIVLAIMILPTIAAISRDVISTVPASQREAMLSLGATRWETTWKVVVPAARAGIVGGIILGLGRAVGETMAVVIIMGGFQGSGFSLLHNGTTIAGTIATQWGEADNSVVTGLLEMALVLLAISVALNALARLLVWSVNRRYAV